MQPEKQDSTLVYEMLVWLEVNRKRLIAAGGMLLVLIVAVYIYVWARTGQHAHASETLLSLVPPSGTDNAGKSASAADYLKFAADHPSTPSALRATWLAAGDLYRQGRYAEAQPHFDRVLAQDRQGLLAAMAALAVASCLDAQDNLDQAVKAYQRVVADYPDSPAAARAKLAMAMVLESQKQPAQALKLYEELTGPRNFGSAAMEASSRRESLLKSHPELAKPVTPVLQPTTPATSTNIAFPTATNAPPADTNKLAGQP